MFIVRWIYIQINCNVLRIDTILISALLWRRQHRFYKIIFFFLANEMELDYKG